MDTIGFEHGGKQYTLTFDQEQWHLTLGPTALAVFPAIGDEPEADLRRRVIAWIDANPDLRGRDQIVLGGG